MVRLHGCRSGGTGRCGRACRRDPRVSKEHLPQLTSARAFTHSFVRSSESADKVQRNVKIEKRDRNDGRHKKTPAISNGAKTREAERARGR